MPCHAKVLALRSQILARCLVDIGPVQPRLVQAAQFDHLMVDALERLIFLIEAASRTGGIQRRKQRFQVQRGVVDHQ